MCPAIKPCWRSVLQSTKFDSKSLESLRKTERGRFTPTRPAPRFVSDMDHTSEEGACSNHDSATGKVLPSARMRPFTS